MSPRLRAAAAAAFIAVVGGVVYGFLTPDARDDKRRAVVHWQVDGGDVAPAEVRCLQTTGLAAPEALALFGLRADAGPQYADVRVCFDATLDAGEDVAELPPGMLAPEPWQSEVAFDGGPQLVVALQGEPEFDCACSTGTGCEQFVPPGPFGAGGWGDAPPGMTLEPGRWRGDGGCYTKACFEMSGVSSWPDECAP